MPPTTMVHHTLVLRAPMQEEKSAERMVSRIMGLRSTVATFAHGPTTTSAQWSLDMMSHLQTRASRANDPECPRSAHPKALKVSKVLRMWSTRIPMGTTRLGPFSSIPRKTRRRHV